MKDWTENDLASCIRTLDFLGAKRVIFNLDRLNSILNENYTSRDDKFFGQIGSVILEEEPDDWTSQL